MKTNKFTQITKIAIMRDNRTLCASAVNLTVLCQYLRQIIRVKSFYTRAIHIPCIAWLESNTFNDELCRITDTTFDMQFWKNVRKIPQVSQLKKVKRPLICYAGSAAQNLDRSKTARSWAHFNINRNLSVIQVALLLSKSPACKGFLS